jgi:glycosyltransferase involved in cell wall biosynthesis
MLVAAPDPALDGLHTERTYMHDGVQVFRYAIPARPTREEAQGSVTVRGAERFHAWMAAKRPDIVHLHTFVTGLGLPELRAARESGARTIVTTHSSSLGFLCMRGTLMQWGERPCDGFVSPSKCAACVLDERGVPRPIAQAIACTPPALARVAAKVPGRLSTMFSMSDIVRRNLEREGELVAKADRFVVLTEGARQILCANQVGNGHVVVNRLGVGWADPLPTPEIPKRAIGDARRPLTVGYVGRFDPIKGVGVLARAVAQLPAALPLTVEFRGPVKTNGEHAMFCELKRIAGQDPRFRFAEPVPHDRVAEVLRDYDALCCPSVCFEGGPTVALEAQAVGTPVIGSRFGGLAEIIEDDVNGRLVAPGDVAALAALLSSIATDPVGTVDRWRSGCVPPRTMVDVAHDYLRLYES